MGFALSSHLRPYLGSAFRLAELVPVVLAELAVAAEPVPA
jgi:hypothetical protein